MSENIFDPIVESIFQCGKVIYKCLSGNKFDFKEFFEAAGLKNKEGQYPKLVKSYNGNLGMTYLFNVPLGLNEGDFKDIKDSLSIQLKKPIEIRVRSGFIEIETIEKELPTNIHYVLPKRSKDSICIPIGESLNGVEFLDLKYTPHSFLCGVTNSGKSVMSKNILTSVVTMYPNDIELVLIDLKRTELSLFKNLKMVKSFTYDPYQAKEIVADILDECNRRFELIEEAGHTTLDDYNKSIPSYKRLKNMIVFIEEFILLDDKTTLKMLTKIAAISRAANIFLILTCQRFSQNEIPITLRSQIGNRIVHQVVDEANSKLVLDVPGAEQIRVKGRAFFKSNSEIREIQGYFISDTEVKKLIEPYLNVKANEKTRPEDLPVKPKHKNELPQALDLSFLD